MFHLQISPPGAGHSKITDLKILPLDQNVSPDTDNALAVDFIHATTKIGKKP